MTKSNGIKDIAGGPELLAYVCTYGSSPSGCEGRLYAQTIGAQMFPRRVRRIANSGLDIVDCDLESAHFNIAAQTVEKLVIDTEGHYFKLAHVREYLNHRQKARKGSAAEYKDSTHRTPQFVKNLCTSAPQGISAPAAH